MCSGRLHKLDAFIRTEGLSALAAAAEAAPNTSTGSVRCAFDLGSANCVVSPTRPRKSFVPRQRPFKMARSRPKTVSVRRWLEPRAASTSLASPSCLVKLGQARRSIPTEWGRERWRMETSTGSSPQLSKSPWCARPWCAPVRPQAPASWPSKFR